MKDWRKSIDAEGLPLSAEEAGAYAARLGALEKRLAGMVAQLAPEDEPAAVFAPEEPSR